MSDGVIGDSAVQQARTQSGVGEPEAFERYVRYWNVPGEPPWCCYFVSWCVDTSAVGAHDHTVPWQRYGGVGSTGSVHAWASAVGKLVSTPEHGDFYGRDDMGHIGLVVGVNADATQIYTINGNWGDEVGYATWNREGGIWTSGNESSPLWFARW